MTGRRSRVPRRRRRPAQIGLLRLASTRRPSPRSGASGLRHRRGRARAGCRLAWELNEPRPIRISSDHIADLDRAKRSNLVREHLNLALRIDHARQVITIATKGGNRRSAAGGPGKRRIADGCAAPQRDRRPRLVGMPRRQRSTPVRNGRQRQVESMVGLDAAGWQAMSEDQCVIEPDKTAIPHLARIQLGAIQAGCRCPVPLGQRAWRFQAVDKVAWQFNGWMARAPPARPASFSWDLPAAMSPGSRYRATTR